MISVVICSYNRSESLKKTLQSLREMLVPVGLSWEVIVADNNSTDNTREVVEDFARASGLNVRYAFEESQGLSHARNNGIKEAKGEIIAFTDDDATVDSYWIWHLKNTFDQFDCVGVGGRIIPLWTCKKPSWLKENGPYQLMKAIVSFDLGEEPCETKTPLFGANMAFKKMMFKKYGLFRIDIGANAAEATAATGEDTEFCRRLINSGEKLIYTPKAIVYHPVEKQRTKKRYFQLWYFRYGRSLIKMESISKNAVCYFGVPRYFFRILLESFLKWFFTFNAQKRFYNKLHFYLIAGEIAESFCILKKGE